MSVAPLQGQKSWIEYKEENEPSANILCSLLPDWTRGDQCRSTVVAVTSLHIQSGSHDKPFVPQVASHTEGHVQRQGEGIIHPSWTEPREIEEKSKPNIPVQRAEAKDQ